MSYHCRFTICSLAYPITTWKRLHRLSGKTWNRNVNWQSSMSLPLKIIPLGLNNNMAFQEFFPPPCEAIRRASYPRLCPIVRPLQGPMQDKRRHTRSRLHQWQIQRWEIVRTFMCVSFPCFDKNRITILTVAVFLVNNCTVQLRDYVNIYSYHGTINTFCLYLLLS